MATNGEQTFYIKNVNLRNFELIVNQAILVKNALMIEFTKDFIRSCAMTQTMTFMKVITIPTDKICVDSDPNNIHIPETFDFFLLKGDLLKPNFNFFKKDTVDLEFNVKPSTNNSGRMVATSFNIIGKNATGSDFKSNIPLTDESMNNESVLDYEKNIKQVTPVADSYTLNITKMMVDEVKQYITKLNKTNPNNSVYITANIGKDYIEFSDKVFKIKYDVDIYNEGVNEPFQVNILKTDWIRLTASTNNDIITYINKDFNDKRIIFMTPYLGSVINSLMMMVDGIGSGIDDNKKVTNDMFDEIDSVGNFELDLDDYGIM